MSEIEPVTDDDLLLAVAVMQTRLFADGPEKMTGDFGETLRYILGRDRRRVAERQAARIADQPMSDYEIGHMEGAEMVVGTMGAELERLRAELEEANERAAGLGEESARFRAEVALRNSEVELFREELKRRCDEVARLTAALNGKENSDA